jgi:hypothetical protein
VTALSLFFFVGAAMAALGAVAAAFEDGPLNAVWEMNEAAQEVLPGAVAVVIAVLAVVALACAAAGIGLWRGARWGYWIAVGLLAVNFVGDILNATIRQDPRAWIGVPITGLLLWYMRSAGVRAYFGGTGSGTS